MQDKMLSKQAEIDMSILISITTAIRNMRSVWNIEPQRAIQAVINTHDKKLADDLLENAEVMKRLARISDLKIGKFPKPKNSAASVVGAHEVYVPLEGLIDFEKETARLAKEEERIDKEIKSITAMLKDKNFVAKAPVKIVEAKRVRKEELRIQLNKLKDNLKEIG